MLFQADLAARLTAVREAVRHGIESNLFINFTPKSVYDPVFCLRSMIETIVEGVETEEELALGARKGRPFLAPRATGSPSL